MGNSTNEDPLSGCCRQCASGEGTKFAFKDLAITGCLAFVAGVMLVLLVLFVLTLKRNKKLCFKEKVEPFIGKWEGASERATIQVLKKHTLEKSREYDTPTNEDPSIQTVTNVSEHKQSDVDLTVKNEETEIPVTEDDTNTPKLTEMTKVDDQIEDTEPLQANVPSDKDIEENTEKETENISTSNNIKRAKQTPTDPSLQSSHLYEKSRGSSVYEQEDLVLQNANFRLSALSNI